MVGTALTRLCPPYSCFQPLQFFRQIALDVSDSHADDLVIARLQPALPPGTVGGGDSLGFAGVCRSTRNLDQNNLFRRTRTIFDCRSALCLKVLSGSGTPRRIILVLTVETLSNFT